MFIIPHRNRDTEEFGTKCNRKRTQQQQQLEMWANAQRDVRPAKYRPRWRRLCNAAKFGLRQCRGVTLKRCQDAKPVEMCRDMPQTPEPISAVSGRWAEVYHIMRTSGGGVAVFFPIVDTYLSSEDIARQSCAMVPKWRLFASSRISSEPRAAHFRPAF